MGGYGSVYGRGNSQISLLEAATNVLQVFNMSATFARQGGRVQLELSDMCLALSIAKIVQAGFLRTAVDVVLATGPGNPPAVRFVASGLVLFSSTPGQKPDPYCVGGVGTATGYIPAGFGRVVPGPWFHFYGSGNIGSNEVFVF
jgi:hypothetical protein